MFRAKYCFSADFVIQSKQKNRKRSKKLKTLYTNRMILRDWCEADIGCEVYNEDSIRYLIGVKNNYAVVLKENNQIIGTIGLNEDADGNPNVRNVGVRILPQYQNHGLMTEALSEVIDTASDITDTLSWFCKVDDERSQHMANKFGFVYVKTFLADQHNLPCDFYYYILKLNSNRH